MDGGRSKKTIIFIQYVLFLQLLIHLIEPKFKNLKLHSVFRDLNRRSMWTGFSPDHRRDFNSLISAVGAKI